MSGWQLSYNKSGTIVPSEASFVNLVGDMVRAVYVVDAGEAASQTPAAGIFVLTADDVNSVVVTARETEDLKSPVIDGGSFSIITDGVTPNLNVIPGLDIRFYTALYAGCKSEIGVGCIWDDTITHWIRLTSLGMGIPGIAASDKTISIQNVSGYPQSNCKLIATNGAYIRNTDSESSPFYSFRQVGTSSPTAHADLTGKVITFTNINYLYTPFTADILVDGQPIDVYDVTHDGLCVEGALLWCDGETVYRFADGTAYQSCEFILSSELDETSQATIYVSDGGGLVEFYDEASADYVGGPSGIWLTGEGCGLGVVPDEELVDVIMRINAPENTLVDLNQRQVSIRINSVGV